MPRPALRWMLTLAVFALARSASAVTPINFQMKTGADLVALCATPTDDPLYMAAIHFCHGFGAGTYQALQEVSNHKGLKPIFCPPDPPPTRNEAIKKFVAWAQANPQYQTDVPADLVGRF